MRVTMIGSGYVGLVSGACFADFGHHVTCVDKDAGRIAALNRGEMPIFEPGLAELVETNVRQGRLGFAGDAASVGDAEVVLIAVGTPSRRGDGHADLSFVYNAVREVAPLLSARSNIFCAKRVPGPICRWCPIRNFCVKAPPSRTSSIPTASSSAPRTSGRAPCSPSCTGRSI
jgi:UDPglucose 6-dehydrogenase